ncbi:MAG TPA: UDP-glucose 4-epimerase GalE [Phycisphaerales bacterium]|nr:UDP-glucose 4-epimerase GalE [Phycisphaerales bacterium]HMP38595.1 UDP-glucose 4-epimerase GalE [Phycisphaerales bacterium]
MRLLVTGGAGYIGSHAARRLLADGHHVTIVDNLVRGHRGAVAAVAAAAPQRLHFAEADIADIEAMSRVLAAARPEAVLHFAALAYVGESVDDPMRYWWNNAAGTISLLSAMRAASVPRLVFSSTCATYGEPPPERVPIDEECPQAPVNPYGRAKLASELVMRDHLEAERRAGRDFAFAALRYFNVAGADRSGRLGEDHRPETHLIPLCLEVAEGRREALTIFGDDYPTPDGTCVRDYVHVEDLVEAHVLALAALRPGEGRAWNVGIGRGHSVREVVESCRRVTGHAIPTREGARRAGDPPALYAESSRIQRELGWRPATTELDEIVADAWRWRCTNPDGYDDSAPIPAAER